MRVLWWYVKRKCKDDSPLKELKTVWETINETEEINVIKEKLTNPKCKINISCTGDDLYTPEKMNDSIIVLTSQ